VAEDESTFEQDVRLFDEIEDFGFDVTHLPGARNPADQLTQRDFIAVFAINNAASTLGKGFTSFFIDRGAHPRLELTAPAASPTASRRHSTRCGCTTWS
jgi:hypothetical protein